MKKYDKRVSVRIPQELYDTLKKLAAADGRSLPNYNLFFIREHVEKTTAG